MKTLLRLLFPLLVLVLGAPLHAAPEAGETGRLVDRIVAVVNDDVITHNELRAAMADVERQLRARGIPLPPRRILERQVLEREIVRRIQLQLAEQLRIRVADSEMVATLDRIARDNGMTIDQLHDTLVAQGIDYPRYVQSIKEEMIIARLQRREVLSRIQVSDREVDNYLATQAVQGNLDEEYHLAHILVSVPEAASPEQIETARRKAESLLRRLREGADFQQLAIAESDAQDALDGGDLGWRKLGRIPTLFARELVRMRPGEVRGPLRSAAGFHIIKLLGKRSPQVRAVTETHVRHILIKPNELRDEAEVIARLRRLKARIEGGEDFAELARQNSEDPGSAAKGGDLGWVAPGELVPEFERVMNGLAPGEISQPFQSPFGWHIAQVVGRRQVENGEEQRRRQAREAIRQRKAQEALEAWLRRLRDEAYVEIRLEP